MSDEKKKKLFNKPEKFSKKAVTAVVFATAVAVILWLTLGQGMPGAKNISFTQLPKEKVPKSIETEVIPEYRELERALGCLIDGKVYVVVTRGEKPTAGYGATIESIEVEKTDKGTNMKVHTLFTEPKEGEAVAQVITYPYTVAKTDMTQLPNTIELIVKYSE